jgi:hypothetical protein
MGWLPDGFQTPARVDLPTGHHLRWGFRSVHYFP